MDEEQIRARVEKMIAEMEAGFDCAIEGVASLPDPEQGCPDAAVLRNLLQALDEQTAKADALADAAEYVKKDLLLRAEMKGDVDPDGTVVVDLGNGAWIGLCDAIADYRSKP